MKKLILGLLLLLSSFATAQNKKTVQDYWKLVGNKKDVIASSLKIDLKNDYISYSGTFEGNGEFAVWRKKNGTDLIGQTRTGCGPACVTQSISFLEPQGTKFTDVTAKVLPKITKTQDQQMLKVYNQKTGEQYTAQQISYYYKFPQRGTSMTIRSGEGSDSDVVLANYKFNGSSFVFEIAK